MLGKVRDVFPYHPVASPFIQALLAVATAPLPSVALVSLATSLLRRPRAASRRATARPVFG